MHDYEVRQDLYEDRVQIKAQFFRYFLDQGQDQTPVKAATWPL